MKKTFLISMLISAALIVCSCGQKNPKTGPDTTNKTTTTTGADNSSNAGNRGPASGTSAASGTITFVAGGTNYSCSVSKIITAPSSLTIQTSDTDVKATGSITITCYTPATAITTGTYTSSSPETISSVTFLDKTFTPFSAIAKSADASCTVNITELTSTTVKGTFTATVVKPLDNTSLSITDGVIDCTVTAK